MTRDYLEKSLLLGIVNIQNWECILKNGITIEYITPANRPLFREVKQMADEGKYTDLKILQYEFNISDEELKEYLTITDYDGICYRLIWDYRKMFIQEGMKELHDTFSTYFDYPDKYIEKIGSLYNDLKLIGHTAKSVNLLENIEEQLKLDPSDVIKTGFEEIDAMIQGWKRGEELVVFMARTGQGKSWFGIKFALSAALKGERVGIYSGEMSKEQLQERLLCCALEFDTDTKEDALKRLQEKNIYIQIITQKELRGRANINDIESFIVSNNLTMLIVDQLSLMEDSTSKPRNSIKTTIW